MKIECTKFQWAIVENLIHQKYNISTEFKEDEFICYVYDEENEVMFDIEGKIKNEIV